MAPRARPLDQLPTWDKSALHVVVECPRGSAVKLKYRPDLEAMTLVRALPLGVVFPFEFGFVPRTRAADGDPLDAAVLMDVPTAAGVVLRCRPIGIVRASQKGSKGRIRNDRLIAVAEGDRRRGHIEEASELPEREREEIERFFLAAVALEGKELELLGWGDARDAREALDEAGLRSGRSAARSRPSRARGRAG
jgi:inorganic pyrophosphatase